MKSARRVAGESYDLLSASMVDRNETVTVTIQRVFEAPAGWKNPLLARITPVMDCDHIALNKTNINALAELLGDDYDSWVGESIEFEKVEYDDFAPGFKVIGKAKAASAKKK